MLSIEKMVCDISGSSVTFSHYALSIFICRGYTTWESDVNNNYIVSELSACMILEWGENLMQRHTFASSSDKLRASDIWCHNLLIELLDST